MKRSTMLYSLMLIAIATAPRSEATIFCVSTGTQLANALTTASSNGQSDSIRLRNGTYTRVSATDADYEYSGNESLHMSGGWSGAAGACTTQTMQPGLSVLDGELQGRVLDIMASGAGSPTMFFLNFTVTRGNAIDSAGAGGVTAHILANSTASVSLNRLQVLASTSSASAAAGIVAQADAGTVYLYGNLIAGNTNSNPQFGVGGLYGFVFDNAALHALNNTIANNTSAAPAATTPGGVYINSRGITVRMANNVVAGNLRAGTPNEIALESGSPQPQFTLKNNHWGVASGVTYVGGFVPVESGTLSGPAGFVSAGDFHLTENSVLRDSGSTADIGSQTIDLDGNPRVLGAAVDRGAYEYINPVLFKSGFE